MQPQDYPDPDHKPQDINNAFYDDLLGRGAGDPDMFGLPDEDLDLDKNQEVLNTSARINPW